MPNLRGLMYNFTRNYFLATGKKFLKLIAMKRLVSCIGVVTFLNRVN